MVLRAAHRLDTFAMRRAGRIDILCDVGGSNKAYSLDVGMSQDCVDGFLVSVDNIEHAFGKARLHHQFCKTHWH